MKRVRKGDELQPLSDEHRDQPADSSSPMGRPTPSGASHGLHCSHLAHALDGRPDPHTPIPLRNQLLTEGLGECPCVTLGVG